MVSQSKHIFQQQAIKDADTRPQIIPTTTDKPLTAAAGDGLLPSDAVCERSIDGQRIIGGTLTKVCFQISASILIGSKIPPIKNLEIPLRSGLSLRGQKFPPMRSFQISRHYFENTLRMVIGIGLFICPVWVVVVQ